MVELDVLEGKASEAEAMIGYLKQELARMKAVLGNGMGAVPVDPTISAALNEQTELQQTVKSLIDELERLENANGSNVYSVNGAKGVSIPTKGGKKAATVPSEGGKKEKKNKGADAKAKGNEAPKENTVSRLDFRVAKIIEVDRHPDADGLYVEKCDLGNGEIRTVCSGLVKFVPMDYLQNRMVILCCNLKPAKMRGILSEAMVMCAEATDKCEALEPPAGAVPGDLVSFEGYPRTPDAQLNPKRKVFESIQPDLNVDDKGVACYKGIPFAIEGKGVCKVSSLNGAIIK
eukprot:Clim_evm14s4 gene=Clim_evmTU14s4